MKTQYPTLCLRVIFYHTLALHSPHLHHLGVFLPGRTGHGRPIHIAHLRVLCLLFQLVPPDQSLRSKDLHLALVLLTQCGNQQAQQPDALRAVYRPLLPVKTISLDTGHSRYVETTAFDRVLI